MSSSDDGSFSSSYADSLAAPELISSSDFECSSDVIAYNNSSDSELLPDSDQELLPDSDNIASASSNPSRAGSRNEASSKKEIECQPQRKRRLRMIDEHEDGVRIKNIPSPKEQFRRRMQQTNVLGDDFFLPNRAQLILNFLHKHADRLSKEKPGHKKRFEPTLQLVQHALKRSK